MKSKILAFLGCGTGLYLANIVKQKTMKNMTKVCLFSSFEAPIVPLLKTSRAFYSHLSARKKTLECRRKLVLLLPNQCPIMGRLGNTRGCLEIITCASLRHVSFLAAIIAITWITFEQHLEFILILFLTLLLPVTRTSRVFWVELTQNIRRVDWIVLLEEAFKVRKNRFRGKNINLFFGQAMQ